MTNRIRHWHCVPQRVFLRVERLESRTTPAGGLTPAMIRHAYGFDQISFTTATGQSVLGDGSGQTIAIVNAYHNPTVASDLDVFNRTYSINGQTLYERYGPASNFLTVAMPQGQPAYNADWAEETALDVQWAHAIAPGARILLVEARSHSVFDLMTAVDYARQQPGVVAVSMSWGSREFRGQEYFDAIFTTPAGHGGVTFVAASGDSGAQPTWPAVSTNVLSVGGTTLRVDSNGNYVGETAWSGSGGGVSRYVIRPDYQDGSSQSSSRGTPDVSYVANPGSGLSVYLTTNGKGRWITVGGTSAGAPQWAALVAIANQGRALAGQGSLDTAATLDAIYGLSADAFRDVISGSNGHAATVGYDLATGRGSPVANRVVEGLAQVVVTSGPLETDPAVRQSESNANRGFTMFNWWSGFGALPLGVVIGPMTAAGVAAADPTFALATPSATVGGSSLSSSAPLLTTDSAGDSDSGAVYTRPASHGLLKFGHGVARVDWSDDEEEEEEEEETIAC